MRRRRAARGLTTSLVPLGTGGPEIQLHFVGHRLHLTTTDGGRHLELRPAPPSSYEGTDAAAAELGGWDRAALEAPPTAGGVPHHTRRTST